MEPHLWLAVGLSALVGLSLGLLGGGGSILAVPILVYVARVEPGQAVALSLAVVGATSLGAAAAHARNGRVDLGVAAVFGTAGMAGAWAGAQLTHLVSDRALLLSFAGLMVLVGGLMLRSRREEATPEGERKRASAAAVMGAGAAVGILTGFLGVGGGFLIVPALVLLAGLPMPRAVGTSLLVISMSSAAGLIGHLGEASPPLGLALAFTGSAVAGALAGERLSASVPAATLRRAFATVVLLVGALLLLRNLPAR